MKTNILILIVATTGLFSCGQASISKTDTVDIETYNSVRNYEYIDSKGNRLIIHNSGPKGGMKYTDPNGEVYGYVGWWTQITNETVDPIELKIDFPIDSFEFPSSSGRYIKLLIPSDTMTVDKTSLPDFGLNIKSFLDNHRFAGGSGGLRTGFGLKGQNLIYKISAYKLTPNLPLIEKKEISCGSINLKNLTLQK